MFVELDEMEDEAQVDAGVRASMTNVVSEEE